MPQSLVRIDTTEQLPLLCKTVSVRAQSFQYIQDRCALEGGAPCKRIETASILLRASVSFGGERRGSPKLIAKRAEVTGNIPGDGSGECKKPDCSLVDVESLETKHASL